MKKKELADIFQETLNIVSTGSYVNSKGQEVVIDGPGKVEILDLKERQSGVRGRTPNISVVCMDSFDIVQKLNEDNVLVLDMANPIDPCGNLEGGARSQEEELCRRSNLAPALRSQPYPLSETEVVYVPKVTVFREVGTYELLDEPFNCSVVAASAIITPDLDRFGMMSWQDVVLTEEKVRSILRVAIKFNHRCIVLGAFGCGAFGNPPRQIASIFKKVLGEDEFAEMFDAIYFAIIEDEKRGNYKTFNEVFSETGA